MVDIAVEKPLINTTKPAKDGVVRETAIYEVSKLLLQKISIAQSVVVQVKGRNGLVERKFTEENFDKFRRFDANMSVIGVSQADIIEPSEPAVTRALLYPSITC